MITWSFADAETGLFIRKLFRGPEYSVGANTPIGTIAVLGKHNADEVKVDWESGEIVLINEFL